MLRRQSLIVYMLFMLCTPQAVAAGNLALHKSCTITPKPDFPTYTDEKDISQLTDGKTYGSNWVRENTVGWRKVAPVAEIVVDLGKKSAIYEVRVNAIGGGFGGAEFPAFVAVLVSEDGDIFRFGGLVNNEELTNVRSTGRFGIARTLTVAKINAAGRYVKLVMKSSPYHLFLDEIEIFGEPASVANKVNFRSNLDAFKTSKELLSKIEDYLQVRENLVTTIKRVKENRHRLSGSLSDKILSELEVLGGQIDMPTNTVYSSGELVGIAKELGKIRAKIYREVYKASCVCVFANPMESLFEKDMCLKERLRAIEIRLWQNEYESAAFNIINCSDEVIMPTVSISPLIGPAGEIVDSDKTITVRRAVFVKASTAGSVADALVLQKDRPFVLQPGEIAQIWLTVFNPTLKAGSYEGRIGVLLETASSKTLPIETISVVVNIQNKKFSENIALNTCNWAYNRVASISETVTDLCNHRINVYVIPPADIPFPRFASDPPGVVRKPDFTKIAKVLRDHDYARIYLLALNFNSKKKDYNRFGTWMTPEWKAAFSSWLIKLVAYLKDAGVGYDKFALYPFDETLCDEFFEFARFAKSIDPKIKLYADSFGREPNDGPDDVIRRIMRFRNIIDIWCPQDSHCMRYPKWLETVKSFGKEVWTYDCLGPAKANDPYSYYRLMPWRAFSRGQTGAGFWVYQDTSVTGKPVICWDETLKPYGYYAVIYGTQNSPVDKLGENIVPSRRWEAWREGVEDYQYLFELQQAINNVRLIEPAIANMAQETLDNQVRRVLDHPQDADVVYDARRILSHKLLKLTNQKDD